MLLNSIVKNDKVDQNTLTAKKPDEDFIPYVCHYDENTILTKNGELLQVIRVVGFKNESAASQLVSLREAVRDAIAEHIKDNKFAFWFTTIRRKKNIVPKGEFKDFFAKNLNNFWVKGNNWDDQYVNELYITLIVEGVDTSIVNLQSFIKSFSHFTIKNQHRTFLEGAHKKLSEAMNGILSEIKDYGAKLLGLKEWEGVVYSEPMRFFGKILNLHEQRYPLSVNDISTDLASHNFAFGNREIEVVGEKGKNFSTLLSLKEYHETSVEALDRILQLPFEFIITQSFDFSFDKKDLEPYEYQNYILQISGDDEFRKAIGIADFVENKKDSLTDYGKLQTTIMLINKDRQNLEDDVKEILDKLGSLGLITIREDIFSEHCFWAQLPGNFSYLRRQKLINTNLIAGFASLQNFPGGLISGIKWKHAVTVFKTVLNTPYFFNFHDGDHGNALIIGKDVFERNVLLNFLIAQAQKFEPKLFYFDADGSSKCFVRALGGTYNIYTEGSELKKNFDEKQDFSFGKINAFGFNEIYSDSNLLISVINYLLEKIEASLDNTPTIIVLNNLIEYFVDKNSVVKIAELLTRLKEKDAIIIFNMHDHGAGLADFITAVKEHISMMIFAANDNPSEIYKDIFALEDDEIEVLKLMHGGSGNFLLKHAEESVIARLALNDEFVNCLHASEIGLAIFDEVVKDKPEAKPEEWLPQFFEVITEMKKQELEDIRRTAREDAIKRKEKFDRDD